MKTHLHVIALLTALLLAPLAALHAAELKPANPNVPTMPDKAKDLERVWQEQADRYTELARKTLPKQPKAKP